jgi:hypothetical protein
MDSTLQKKLKIIANDHVKHIQTPSQTVLEKVHNSHLGLKPNSHAQPPGVQLLYR